MAPPTAFTNPIRERSFNGEVPHRAAGSIWEANFDIVFSKLTGGSSMLIPKDIDPEGLYKAIPDLRALRAPVATLVTPLAPTPEDVPEPVTLTILQGDQKFHHQRSPDEAPAPFLEGESDEESDESEVGAGSTSGPPEKVNEGNVVTLGPLDNGAGVELVFGSVLDAHVSASWAK